MVTKANYQKCTKLLITKETKSLAAGVKAA